jgi:hypothetical protein
MSGIKNDDKKQQLKHGQCQVMDDNNSITFVEFHACQAN